MQVSGSYASVKYKWHKCVYQGFCLQKIKQNFVDVIFVRCHNNNR